MSEAGFSMTVEDPDYLSEESLIVSEITFEDRIVYDMPDGEYRAVEALSGTGCIDLLRSPLHYRYGKDNPTEVSEAMTLGTAFHCSLLTPEVFEQTYVVIPDHSPRRPNSKQINAKKPSPETLAAIEFWQNFDDEHCAKLSITGDQMTKIEAMTRSIKSHAGCALLLETGFPEVSLFWRDAAHNIACKGRLDWWRPEDRYIVDVKTTRDASPSAFGRHAASMEYEVQAAHYWTGIEHLYDEGPKAWFFVCVENEAPYAAACYAMPADALRLGMNKQERACKAYELASRSKYWAGYSPEILPLDFPSWALKQKTY